MRTAMTRQQKYPDTSTFFFFNANPKKRYTGDCRIRAISTATGIDYNEIVLKLAYIQIETGYDQCTNQGIDILMDRLGWKKQKQPRKKDGTKYTGKEFCKVQQRGVSENGIVISPRVFCNIGGHHEVAIIDGRVWDTWDSTEGCIGNYWIKG